MLWLIGGPVSAELVAEKRRRRTGMKVRGLFMMLAVARSEVYSYYLLEMNFREACVTE